MGDRYRVTLNLPSYNILTLLAELVDTSRPPEDDFELLASRLRELSSWPEKEWHAVLPLVEHLRSCLYNMDEALNDITNIIQACRTTHHEGEE